ncbi:MAG: DUF4087 domain-containing protein [Microcoleus vaginatus WJT46-NPBG5]|jgi:hypothetical protein|nr:DUF4087 domain-containing protein [Microcoleus vaginatus WJT46-NPBG5]
MGKAMKRNWLITLALVSIALPVSAEETRCGWLHNPTPGNWLLRDRDNNWIISRQGGYQAEGTDNIPNFNAQEYVKTNRLYGYGCACLDVETDSNTGKILTIQSGEILPLNACRTDPDLPQF